MVVPAMKFDDLDRQMRVFETSHDHCVLPGIHMVARLDGRGFTRLTKEVCDFEAPFDTRFRDHMLATVEHLMGCGFQVVYGYTQSDEISLLFHPDEDSFGRKLRKYHSVLAGEASACFSLAAAESRWRSWASPSGAGAREGLETLSGFPSQTFAFDCRICQLPRVRDVVDYFLWRQADAHRNALNAHCYWMLRKQGQNVHAATNRLEGMTVAAKNELLFQGGVNFNDLPNWQKRGMGLLWEEYDKPAHNPITGEETTARRRRIRRELDLPMREEYAKLIEGLVTSLTTTDKGGDKG
jgi:tRNA(His) guanylyltransferase